MEKEQVIMEQYNHLFTTTLQTHSWDSIRFENNDRLGVRFNNEGTLNYNK